MCQVNVDSAEDNAATGNYHKKWLHSQIGVNVSKTAWDGLLCKTVAFQIHKNKMRKQPVVLFSLCLASPGEGPLWCSPQWFRSPESCDLAQDYSVLVHSFWPQLCHLDHVRSVTSISM